MDQETTIELITKTYLDGRLVTQGREPILKSELAKAKRTKKGYTINHGNGMVTKARELIK